MKTCSTCGELKENEFFSKHHKGSQGLQHNCKQCCKELRVSYYKKYPERNRIRSIKNNYGISFEELEEKYRKQSGFCAICNRPIKLFAVTKEESVDVGRVDHDHTTGKTRGLLCNHCNIGLGHFFDNKVLIERAKEYLEEYDN